VLIVLALTHTMPALAETGGSDPHGGAHPLDASALARYEAAPAFSFRRGCDRDTPTRRCSDDPNGGLLHPALRPLPREPDASGLRQDTHYFLGYQFFVLGILYVMPEGVSGWSPEQKREPKVDKWWNNVRRPTWDKDRLYINYVSHPYWGAAYFVRARERGYDRKHAFWYSVLLSTLFEFGAEAIFEQPSIQDLVVTPVFGSLLGIHFMEWRDQTKVRIVANGEVAFRDRVVLAATDPLGALNRIADRTIGRDVTFVAVPFIAHPHASRSADEGPAIGVRMHLSW
jgi:hypothetical protein